MTGTSAKQLDLKVAAFMTAPRYGAVYAVVKICQAFATAGVPLNVSGGVFYGQCMQKMLVDAKDRGIDLAVTVDFDSLFSAADVNRLIQVVAANPEVDALAAFQSRRGNRFPLLTQGKANQIEVDGSPIRVTTAHFGLTVLRMSAFEKLPKPWFYSQPTPSGDWVQNVSTDDDIWFWKQWAAAGNSLYVDPCCRIGHLEEIVSSYDDTLSHQLHYQKEWENGGAAILRETEPTEELCGCGC